jgi:DNA-binding NtrC family response regulator
MKKNAAVLIVDDEPNAIRVLSAILRSEGYTVLEAPSVERAVGILSQNVVDAVITDIKMPQQDGYHLFDYIEEHAPHIPLMFLTAYGSVDSAVEAISNGAFYYFVKPPDYQKLKKVLEKAIEQNRQKMNAFCLPDDACKTGGPHLIGRHPAMTQVFRKIATMKDTDSSVLICGETGTGKEIVANHLHFSGNRSDKPFVAVNCAAIPRELLESELFGYEKGAFTGAAGCRTGKVEEASGGTLFLDEIGEMEPSLQAKLLRVLQEKTIGRIGSNKQIKVDFRLISSTNRDLKKEMESGAFRKDLYYRINVARIDLPPLRERKEDMPLLISEFMNEFCQRESKQLTLSSEVMNALLDHTWPGNVRQLKNVLEYAVAMSAGPTITLGDLPDDLRVQSRRKSSAGTIEPLKSVELQAIHNALTECKGNKSQAARLLMISRKALYTRLRAAKI